MSNAAAPRDSDATVGPTDPVAADGPEPTIGQLVASASRDVSTLVRKEIELAKTELAQAGKAGGMGVAMFAGAAFFSLFGLGFLLTALAWGLTSLFGWSAWLAFLVVALLLFIITGVLAMIGKKKFSRVGPPTRAIATTQETIATLKGSGG